MASDSENVWDDTLLVRAYDNSIKLANSEIAKRIASSTNTSEKVCTHKANISELLDTLSYKVGDYVRATYEDEIDYEAKIIAVDKERNTCTIRYIGYDNEQEVALNDILPSWGKKARRTQFTKAKADKKTKEKIEMSSVPNYRIPPPPPIPPMLNELNEDSENISAMLMSWYMSGYYTGLYQGQKMAKTKIKYKNTN